MARAVALIALVPIACQTTATNGGVEPAPAATQQDHLRSSKRLLDRAIAAFYRDQWANVGAFADQMSTTAERWEGLAKEERLKEESMAELHGYAAATKELKATSAKNDVQATTQALRRIAAHLGKLESHP